MARLPPPLDLASFCSGLVSFGTSAYPLIWYPSPPTTCSLGARSSARWISCHHRRLPRGVLVVARQHSGGCTRHGVVGLRLPGVRGPTSGGGGGGEGGGGRLSTSVASTDATAQLFSRHQLFVQINGVANRTTIADGNTWNHEHIALLGKCLVSPESASHAITRHLADYVLIWTTRHAGMHADDLAKSPHMARIAGSVYPDINPQVYAQLRPPPPNTEPLSSSREPTTCGPSSSASLICLRQFGPYSMQDLLLFPLTAYNTYFTRRTSTWIAKVPPPK